MTLPVLRDKFTVTLRLKTVERIIFLLDRMKTGEVLEAEIYFEIDTMKNDIYSYKRKATH